MDLKIRPYLDIQIRLEEKYYNALYETFVGLIILLNDFIETSHYVSLIGLINISNKFYKDNLSSLEALNQRHAIAITQVGYDAFNHSDIIIPVESIKISYTKHMAVGLNIKTLNLFDTIVARYIALFPIGAFGIDYLLFNDENTKEDLIKRCNNSISRYAQSSTTEGIISTIIYEAEQIGATEYLPDNQHDDKVRETHRKYFNGESWIKFGHPPPCGHVGTEYGCRCVILAVR